MTRAQRGSRQSGQVCLVLNQRCKQYSWNLRDQKSEHTIIFQRMQTKEREQDLKINGGGGEVKSTHACRQDVPKHATSRSLNWLRQMPHLSTTLSINTSFTLTRPSAVTRRLRSSTRPTSGKPFKGRSEERAAYAGMGSELGIARRRAGPGADVGRTVDGVSMFDGTVVVVVVV